MISKKVILVGRYGVGKTSLIRQYVHQKFSEEYLTTIGVKIDKKVVEIDGTPMSMIIWDIAGEASQSKIQNSYKLGSNGVIYVFDLLRPNSYTKLDSEISALNAQLPGVPVILVGNKKDLVETDHLTEVKEELKPNDIIFTSAKTGENVEQIFQTVASEMLK